MADPVFLFGGFRLSRFGLLLDGQPQKIQPKPLAVLYYLASRFGREVSKDELNQAVWRDAPATEQTIERTVTRARQAVGDIEEPRRFIKTATQVGWIWVYEPQVLDPKAQAANARPHVVMPSGTSTPIDRLASRPSTSETDRCKELLEQAEAALLARDTDRARAALFEAVDLAQSLDSAALSGRALCDLGEYFLQTGDLLAAQARFEQVLHRARERRDTPAIVIYLNDLGVALRRRNLPEEARKLYEEGLKLALQIQDVKHQSLILLNIGRTYIDTGDGTAALKLYRQSSSLARETDNDWVLRRALNEVGAVTGELGNHVDSVAAYAEALTVAARSGTAREQQLAHQNLAVALFDHRAYEEARVKFLEAHTRAKDLGHIDAQIDALIGLGRAHTELHDGAGAVMVFTEALRLSEAATDDVTKNEALVNLGTAWLSVGRVDSAIECLRESISASRRLGSLRDEGIAWCQVGQALDWAEHPQASITCYKHALRLAEQTGDDREAATYLHNLAHSYAELRHAIAVDFAIRATAKVHSSHPTDEAVQRTRDLAWRLRRAGLWRRAYDTALRGVAADPDVAAGAIELLLALKIQ